MIAQQQIQKGQSGALSLPGGKRPERPCVLLVEDDRSLRRYLEVVLRQEGYEVFVAADGLEAMKISLRSAVDVVVTDANGVAQSAMDVTSTRARRVAEFRRIIFVPVCEEYSENRVRHAARQIRRFSERVSERVSAV